MKIIVINGPNLNMLGIRKPEIYGIETLEAINNYIKKGFPDAKMDFFQSNSEAEILDKIHFSHKSYTGIVLNPGALAHYSIALRDAIEACILPVVEVHLSNTAAREEFRRVSVISPVCAGTISGLGKLGYRLAIQALDSKSSKKGK